jgi:hypothetical protein
MLVVKVLAIAVLALVFGVMVEGGPAKAAEVFVCEGGRLVRVKPGELERLKRTDPCIARYFGLSIGGPETERPEAAPAEAEPFTPQPRSGRQPRDGGPMTPIAHGSEEDRGETVGRVIEAAAEPKETRRPKLPSDHRNVLLLNAEPGASPYFILRR